MRIIFLIILTISGLSAKGQRNLNPYLFFQQEQSINSISVFNPGSISSTEHLNFAAGNQFNAGPFRNNRKFYFRGAYRLKVGQGGRGRSTVGINMQGDQEGDLLQRARVNLLYSWSTKIDERISIAMGVAVGSVNYFVQSTSISAGGSDADLDGHVGLWIYGTKGYFGLSVSQILDGTLTPIEESVPLSKHYYLIWGREIDLSHEVFIHFSGIYNYDPIYANQLDLSLTGNFNNKFMLGTVFRTSRSMVLLAGLKNLKFDKTELDVTFSYSYPLGFFAKDLKVYGVDLKLRIAKKKNRGGYLPRHCK